MRRHEQLSLDRPWIDHPHARELEAISRLLDEEPGMAERVGQDLVRGVKHPQTGRAGMSGDQVLRVLVVKQMNVFSYEELHFHLVDSTSYRTFCRFGALEEVPSRSAVAENLKKVRFETLEEINQLLLKRAEQEGVERGRKVRIDSTVVETNIHAPSDSTLLWDAVRVLTRLLEQARATDLPQWRDHTRRAKRRMLAIQRAKTQEEAQAAVPRPAEGLAQGARLRPQRESGAGGLAGRAAAAAGLRAEPLRAAAGAGDRPDRAAGPPGRDGQRTREGGVDLRAAHGHHRQGRARHPVRAQGLPQRGRLGAGPGLRDRGRQPRLSTPMLQRHMETFGRPPRQAALDGGFASKQNLSEAKEFVGVQDVCFSKKRGLKVSEMVKRTWVYRKLRNFRAGIDGVSSFLKRAFGLDRCTWRGELSFRSYVWSSIVSANLLTLARHRLA